MNGENKGIGVTDVHISDNFIIISSGGDNPCFNKNKLIVFDFKNQTSLDDEVLNEGNITNLKFINKQFYFFFIIKKVFSSPQKTVY
jgi:hypothetical protein